MSPLVRHPAAVLLLCLSLGTLLALSSGCGGSDGEATDETAQATPFDSLSVLADEVDDAFLKSLRADELTEETRTDAFNRAEVLITEVLGREQPETGWTHEDLQAALRERRLQVEIHDIGSLPEPWLVRIVDPLRAASSGRMLVVYPATGYRMQVDPLPFEREFEIASWTDSSVAKFVVAGWRRTRGGLQPNLWLFRLPEAVEASDGGGEMLYPYSETPLSSGSASGVEFVPGRENRPPSVRVTEAALPNVLFDECANCPHLFSDLTFQYLGGGYVLDRNTPRKTPYAAFVNFIDALMAYDEARAREFVADPVVIDIAREFGFDRHPRRGRWRIAPGSDGSALDQIYLRGEEGAFRVLMSVRGSNFVVTSLSPTEFLID